METSSRRKACDTCCKKKIKCDMMRPACSNCVLYKVPCITTTSPRRAAQISRRASRATSTNVEDNDSLEARLARIEAKLDRISDPSVITKTDQVSSNSSSQGQAVESVILSVDTPLKTPTPRVLESHGEYCLPPLTEILPVIDDYFRDFNSALPLFHQQHFMQMVLEFYSEQDLTKKLRAVWAAINVVLALGYRIKTVEAGEIIVRFDDVKLKHCIDNAQRELDELVTREEDTLGIEVILGLVILFQTNTDQNPASVLIGTAVRLAHRLGLHMKSTLSQFSPDVAQHRSNIFWLCYYLDKDICFRSKIPSIQCDYDIDLDLPEDNGNYLQSIDGSSQLNYLRARVQLAYLEGKIYDDLLSNRSSRISLEARQERVTHLDGLLNRWVQTIPEPMQLEKITETVAKAPLSHLILLYHTYLICYTTINGLYSLSSPWMKAVNGVSGAVLRSFETRAGSSCAKHQQPLLPRFWDTCVRASRGCLNILNNKRYSGCNLWLGGCAYFSAFVVLQANIIYFPSHELVDYDRELMKTTKECIAKVLDQSGSESFKTLQVVLSSLEQAANYAAEQAKSFDQAFEFDPIPLSLSATRSDFHYTYAPSQFETFSNGDVSQNNLIAHPEMPAQEVMWPQGSTFGIANNSSSTFAGMDFSDELSVPEFMRELL
ncbi:fungal-specific transcription factor domain-containing protein [Daldinia caldariorum]|uniref:fungal-specific transcription factor domain-containing protein n=1 Tax=Daldinia caldariorum TaxID=326644 RepID=UPI0020084C83|nr:fungal-specific transcription factor domain-containing protein [Daldinia caldariorum]KAI1468023.1 fungal-specific transcription factor domain-containing protein [Daldinia caldariorum]